MTTEQRILKLARKIEADLWDDGFGTRPARYLAGELDHTQEIAKTVDLLRQGVALGREMAGEVVRCHSDDRPRRDSMDWNDGYMDGCKGASDAIRALGDTK